MKKILLTIATIGLLCSCDKITIKESEVAGTFWSLKSRYTEYVEDGQKKGFDTAIHQMSGLGQSYWHFKNHTDIVEYSDTFSELDLYSTYSYDINLQKKRITFFDRNGKQTVYTICKFTDNELIVEYRGQMYSDENALIGYRFVKSSPLSEEELLKYVPRTETPTNDTYWYRSACYYFTENEKYMVGELHFSTTNEYGQEYWHFKNDKELVRYTEKEGVPSYYQNWGCEVDLTNNKLATIDNKGERVEYTIIYEFTQRELLIDLPATINGTNGKYRLHYQRINPDKYNLNS